MWLRDITQQRPRAMLAAGAGDGLYGFDFMVSTVIIPTLITLWGMSKAQAGYSASATLLTSAIGGSGAGMLADRWCRVRVLQLTVVCFAVVTFPFPRSAGSASAMNGRGISVGCADPRRAPPRQSGRYRPKQRVARLGELRR